MCKKKGHLQRCMARGSLSLLVESPPVERIDVYNDSFSIKPENALRETA